MNLELGLEPPAREQERPFTVTELTESVRQHVQLLPAMWVEGEVSELKTHRSGQLYFKLKDAASVVDCVMWADEARRLQEKPQDGTKVFARAKFTVFARQGRLQLTVYKLLPTAEGGPAALALEQARAALEKDGLLDPARKRPLPAFPRCLGVVTSPVGAAWKDIVAVVSQRWPMCELVLVAATVQGEAAPREIVRAIDLANRFTRLDALIVGRGGGSKEDLAAFNDERVARAVAGSRVPTISAVGHEIDVTLTDLVADVRAPTPSAAAEMAVPHRDDVARRMAALARHLSQAAGGRLQRVDHLLRTSLMRMRTSCVSRFASASAAADRLQASLDALSPLRVLGRGYAIARDDAGRVLRRAADFAPSVRFRLTVSDGDVMARTEP